MQKIGKKLKKLRKARRITVKDVAAMTGFSASFVYAIEQERKNPCYENIMLLCEKLDVPPSYFFDDSKTKFDMVMDNGALEVIELLDDYGSWNEDDQKDLINFIKYKKSKVR